MLINLVFFKTPTTEDKATQLEVSTTLKSFRNTKDDLMALHDSVFDLFNNLAKSKPLEGFFLSAKSHEYKSESEYWEIYCSVNKSEGDTISLDLAFRSADDDLLTLLSNSWLEAADLNENIACAITIKTPFDKVIIH